MRRAAVSSDLFARGGEPLGAAGADRHPRTRLGKSERDRAADAAAAAGDDRALAGKIDVHVISPQDPSESLSRDRLYHADDPAVRVAAVRARLAASRSMTK